MGHDEEVIVPVRGAAGSKDAAVDGAELDGERAHPRGGEAGHAALPSDAPERSDIMSVIGDEAAGDPGGGDPHRRPSSEGVPGAQTPTYAARCSPVRVERAATSCAGVPSNTIRPPSWPAPGPRSMIQSACAMTP